MEPNDMDLNGRCLLKETDLTQEEFGYLVNLGARLRSEKRRGQQGSLRGCRTR